MADHLSAQRFYLDLTAHLIDREIAKFRRGEQAALVSFSHVAKLARAASEELMAPGPRQCADRCDASPRVDSHRRSA
jgi:hypothetical protein